MLTDAKRWLDYLRLACPVRLLPLSVQVMEKLPTFAPHMEAVELTNALWACGKLEVVHDGVFEQLIPILINLCAA